jgi:hypothetical protein
MNSIQLLALFLLLERVVSVTFMSMVVRKQYRLFKFHIDTGLVAFRKVMFAMSVVFLLSNVIPIIVDVFYAFIDIPQHADPILKVYTFSNATAAMVASIFLWLIYRIAGKDFDESIDE